MACGEHAERFLHLAQDLRFEDSVAPTFRLEADDQLLGEPRRRFLRDKKQRVDLRAAALHPHLQVIDLDDPPRGEEREMRLDDAQADEHLDEPRLVRPPQTARRQRETRALDAMNGSGRARQDGREGDGLPGGKRNEDERRTTARLLAGCITSGEYGRRPVGVRRRAVAYEVLEEVRRICRAQRAAGVCGIVAPDPRGYIRERHKGAGHRPS